MCNDSRETAVCLSYLGMQSNSRMSQLHQTLGEVVCLPATHILPDTYANTSLFPLSPRLSKRFFKEQAKTPAGTLDKSFMAVAMGMVAGLNYLYCAGWSDRPFKPEAFAELSVAQRNTLSHIHRATIDYLGIEAVPFTLHEQVADLATKRIAYDGSQVSVRERMVSAEIIAAWPAVGDAAVCPVSDHIDTRLANELADPASCLLPREDWPEQMPVSKVHADRDEWFRIVQAGAARGMFVKVEEQAIFRNQYGAKVLNGAMVVAKYKELDGELRKQQRFISVLTPVNAFMRALEGDESTLPQACFLTRIILADGQVLSLDAEDFTSCFNLLTLDPCWHGYLTFDLQVDSSAFGDPPGQLVWVALAVVPMGWSWSVGIIHFFLRRYVFTRCRVPPHWEVQGGRDFPLDTGAMALTCIDGFDLITLLPQPSDRTERLPPMEAFVERAGKLGLPLNFGKEVINSYNNMI